MLQPRRDIYQQGEAGCVGLWKAVLSKAPNLAKYLLGKLVGQPAAPHALQELGPEPLDDTCFPPSTHGAAKLVGFARSESGGDDCQLHRLFLEDGDAQRPLQDRANFLVGIGYQFIAVSPPQVGMHHVPLNRSGTNNGNLNYEVVPAAGPQSGEHTHLPAAFDLEDANRIRRADHVVDRRVFAGNIGQCQLPPRVLFDQGKAAPDRREHAEAEAVDLEQAELFEIFLVPLNHGAAIHRRVFDRNQLIQVSPGHHHPADVLGEMPGKAEQLVDQEAELPAHAGLGIESNGLTASRKVFYVLIAVDLLGERIDPVE